MMIAVKPSCRAAQRVGLVVRASAQPPKAPEQVKAKLEIPPVVTVAVANAIAAMPAAAETGKLFDFNATLPVMAGQFLLLMVFLDKFWFSPVGKVLDDRDKLIRDQLAAVKGDSSELSALQDEAEKVLKEARAAANKAVSDAKSTTQAEQSEKLAKLKEEVDKELAAAIAELDKERQQAQSSVDEQVEKLTAEILTRVLPEGVSV